MKCSLPFLSLLLIPLLVPSASAQPAAPAAEMPDRVPAKPADKEAGAVSRRDRRFVIEVLRINHNETVIAQLVAERASTRQVTALARQLISDLGEATRELRALAEKKHISLPEPRAESGELKTWNEKALAAVDADYLGRAQDALDDLATLYEKASVKSTDPELVAFAKKLLPAVREQQKRAAEINPKVIP
jgi:predicted outer membrane protein